MEEPAENMGTEDIATEKIGPEKTRDSLLIKPLGTGDLLRQVEALLISHADKQLQQRNSGSRAQEPTRRAG